MRVVSIAVPVPFLDLLTYNVPGHLELPSIGARVRVRVGSRTVTGCVVEQGTPEHGIPEAPAELKDVVEIVDSAPFLPAAIVELCRWVADYYVAGIGDAIAVAMPPGARAKASSFRTRRVATLTAHGLSCVPHPDTDRLDRSSHAATPHRSLTAKQGDALIALAAASAGLPLSELRDRGVTADVLARLAARGLVAIRDEIGRAHV